MAAIADSVRLDRPVPVARGRNDPAGLSPTASVGVVVIGRNEGRRLYRCLVALRCAAPRTVYVDSGSSDGSLATARAMGVEAIALDPVRPYSAARGRNEGFRRLDNRPGGAPPYIQFVDGDCELQRSWLEYAAAELDRHPELAIVCGRLREKGRNASIYSRLCDMEWRRPVGPMDACGGIFMIRSEAFRQVGGFHEQFVLGEERDLCTRLIRMGWKLERLDAEMGTHDSGMRQFGEWWTRSVRGGYAYALSAALAGPDRSRAFVRERLSAWMWAGLLPLLALALAWPTYGLSLLLLGAYPIQAMRIARKRRAYGESSDDRYLYGAACVMSKLPQLQGQLRFALEQLRSIRPRVIEYREPGQAALSSEW